MKYFNVNLKEKEDGMKLTRENYIKVNNRSSFNKNGIYSDEWCEQHKKKCLENYDLNMKYFQSLDPIEFNNCIKNFLEKNSDFIEITNLNDADNISGYYLLILSQYSQCYIGTSNNIKKRIMNHWSKTKQFDRLIFGSVNNSILSIDSFRAFDTSKIYIKKSDSLFSLENDLINDVDKKFILNGTIGGLLEGGLNESISERKVRELD